MQRRALTESQSMTRRDNDERAVLEQALEQNKKAFQEQLELRLKNQEQEMRVEYKSKLQDILVKIQKKQAQFEEGGKEKDHRIQKLIQNEQVYQYQMENLESKLEKQQKLQLEHEKLVRDLKDEKEQIILSMHPLST